MFTNTLRTFHERGDFTLSEKRYPCGDHYYDYHLSLIMYDTNKIKIYQIQSVQFVLCHPRKLARSLTHCGRTCSL